MRPLAPIVLLTAFTTGAPAQTARNLPDFTSLMKQQGPAVVNVITKREAGRSGRGAQGQQGQPPEDPLLEFFRRFMPDAPERMPGPGLGLGSGFIVSQDGYVL
ncbi:MAG TPA: serine peptidase, partial [Burkholderiales bacterium]|nr:serine peptidase [Burkholderiales bacterium]